MNTSDKVFLENKLKEAEIYAKQGLLDEALEIYRELKNIVPEEQENLRKEIQKRTSELETLKGLVIERAAYILRQILQETPNISKNKLEILNLKKVLAEYFEKIYEFDEALKLYVELASEIKEAENIQKKIEYLKDITTNCKRLKFLIKERIITPSVCKKAAEIAKENNSSIEHVLIEEFRIPKNEIGKALARFYNCPFIEISEDKIVTKPECLKGVKESFLRQALIAPLEENGQIFLLTENPFNLEQIEQAKKFLNLKEFEVAVSIREDVLKLIDLYYGKFLSPISKTLEFELELVEEEEVQEEEEPVPEDQESVVVKLANYILEEAYRRGASDIHIENLPGRRGAQIRFRIDGECIPFQTVPYSLKRPLVSRYKIMAGLDIAEKRLPQDGKIKFRTRAGKVFELRVATLPTIENNEDVVMRILGGVQARTLEEIDLRPEIKEQFQKLIERPYGLMLVVGPTGSGKTTTLHAALHYINRPNKKIWTAEDPVEIVQEGLRQVQVKPKIGLTFARVLRAFLRADPDIIMIGETRDAETAHTLIEASLTGHLVFSTLHTNSAPETVTRLLGMGIDPYNFADALLGILAQRLAKRLCPDCKEPFHPTEKEIEELIFEYGEHPLKPLSEEEVKQTTLYRPVGCNRCHHTGYRGRLAIHELLVPNDKLRELMIRGAPVHEIREAALQNGMFTLKQDGILKVLKGETDLKQIRAVCVR